MAWYPDWAVALDNVAKGKAGATVTQQNARDITRAIEKLQDRIAELEQRPYGTQIGHGNIQTNAQDAIRKIEKLQNLLAEVQEHVRGTA